MKTKLGFLNRTLLIIGLFFLFNTTTYSQIQSFTFESFKDYDNNVRIAYFNIDGIKDINEEYFAQKKLRENLEITRFFLYSKENDLNRCMIETKSSVDEIKIESLINKAITDFNILKSQYSENIWEFYKVIYDIPSDCPIFKYKEITEENKDTFISEINKWKEANIEKYNEIKHLKEEISILKK